MPTLMIYVVRESDSGLYHCRVTHPQGVLDSRPARVTIVPLRQPIHEFPGPLPYSYSHHGYPLPRDEPSPYSSSSVDLYHEQSSSRRGSCDTASLTSLDSLQIGAHKTYSEAGGTGLSPRGHLSGMPLHIQGMPEDHRSTTLPEGLCVQDMEQCNNISDYQPLVTVRNMNTWSQMYFQYWRNRLVKCMKSVNTWTKLGIFGSPVHIYAKSCIILLYLPFCVTHKLYVTGDRRDQ